MILKTIVLILLVSTSEAKYAYDLASEITVFLQLQPQLFNSDNPNGNLKTDIPYSIRSMSVISNPAANLYMMCPTSMIQNLGKQSVPMAALLSKKSYKLYENLSGNAKFIAVKEYKMPGTGDLKSIAVFSNLDR